MGRNYGVHPMLINVESANQLSNNTLYLNDRSSRTLLNETPQLGTIAGDRSTLMNLVGA